MSIKNIPICKIQSLVCLIFLVCNSLPYSYADTPKLKVTTSSNPDSNATKSFIYLPSKIEVLEGIKLTTTPKVMAVQVPLSFSLDTQLSKSETIQWKIYIKDKAYGRINLVSTFPGSYRKITPGRLWLSEKLNSSVKKRTTLLFRPNPQKHQPPLYKKGRGKKNKRRKYGGGTKAIDDYIYNPRLSYEVTAVVFADDKVKYKLSETVLQDDFDLLRQEYINHYDRARYGRGDNGNIPVPLRSELSEKPDSLSVFGGEGISESNYSLIIDDNIVELAQKVAAVFEEMRSAIHAKEIEFVDLDNKPLPITENKLWLSSGWRNPERNEWYSNAINGMHQRGGAVDIIPNERPDTRLTAATYWLLWKAINQNKDRLQGHWQLEVHGRPMKTREYKDDITPKNGIPDAFDIADHLHIQMGDE